MPEHDAHLSLQLSCVYCLVLVRDDPGIEPVTAGCYSAAPESCLWFKLVNYCHGKYCGVTPPSSSAGWSARRATRCRHGIPEWLGLMSRAAPFTLGRRGQACGLIVASIAEDLRGDGRPGGEFCSGRALRDLVGAAGDGRRAAAAQKRMLRCTKRCTGAHIHFVGLIEDYGNDSSSSLALQPTARVPRSDPASCDRRRSSEAPASIAKSISELLGFATVAAHRHCPAWDDFEVTTVQGSPEAELVLATRAGEVTRRTRCSMRALTRSARATRTGEFDWETHAPGSYVLVGWYSRNRHRRRHPLDALFVPLRHADGHLIRGILSS